MKGFVILDDIPIICAECVLSSPAGKFILCQRMKKIAFESKPDWCPIKPISKEVEMQLFIEGKR